MPLTADQSLLTILIIKKLNQNVPRNDLAQASVICTGSQARLTKTKKRGTVTML